MSFYTRFTKLHGRGDSIPDTMQVGYSKRAKEKERYDMTEPTKLQKIISKIQQLRKISESTHSKNEKETTIALAAKLIAEYQLTEAEVAVKENIVEGIELEGEHIIYETTKRNRWKSDLAIGVAELNGLFLYNAQVRGAVTHRLQTRYRVIGKKSNITIALYMFEFLVTEITELAKTYVPGGVKRGINPERESWALGCVQGFMAKMRGEKAKVLTQATSTAMVLIGNEAKEAEEAWKQSSGIKLRSSSYKPKGQVVGDVFQSGYRKGQTLNVAPGIESSQTETKQIG